MDWSNVTDDFYPVIVASQDVLWHSTAAARGRAHHGVARCPQRLHPGAWSDGREATCDPCGALHGYALVVLDQKLRGQLAGTLRERRARARTAITRYADQIVIEARRRSDAEEGLYSKLSNLSTSKWFIEAVPAVDDQELVMEVLHFARSADDANGHEVPFERIGSRLGLDAVACERRWVLASAALFDARPDFMDANFDKPMARRWAAGLGCVELIAS